MQPLQQVLIFLSELNQHIWDDPKKSKKHLFLDLEFFWEFLVNALSEQSLEKDLELSKKHFFYF